MSLRKPLYFLSAIAALFAGCLALVEVTNAQISANGAQRQPMVRGVIVKWRSDLGVASAMGDKAQPASASANARIKALGMHAELDTEGARHLGGGHHAVAFAKRMDAAQVALTLKALRANPDVLSAEPDELLYRKAVPSDPDYATKQWHLQASTAFAGAINMPTAWNTSTGSSSVVVAVLDTGIRPHPELVGRYAGGYDFVTNDVLNGVAFAGDGDGRDADPTDPGDWINSAESTAIGNDASGLPQCDIANSSWHGTFIAGIIAAATNNGAGIAGINWASKILPVRVAGKCGAYSSNIIDGMRWAAGLAVDGVPSNPTPAKVINLSFGGTGSCSSAYQTAINEVTAAGSLVVVAAGNESTAVGKPANCANAMAVGAARHDGLKTSYSNYGSQIALVAPGGAYQTGVAYASLELWSLSNTGTQGPVSDTYAAKVGTSFSAPVVAGVASLMLSINPALKPTELIKRMQSSARPHVAVASLFNSLTSVSDPVQSCASYSETCTCTTATCGAGLLDAGAAMAAALYPAANIGVITSPAVSTSVTLDGRASGAVGASVNTYLWTQTAGTAISIPSPTAALNTIQLPNTAGTYTFKLQVADSLGRTGTDEMTFTSMVPPPAPAASSGGGALSFVWSLGLLGLMAIGLRGASRRRAVALG